MSEANQNKPGKDNKELPFYRKRWFLTMSLLFLTPIGIFLWFKFPTRPRGKVIKTLKVIISIFLLIIWTFLAYGVATGFRTSETFEVNGATYKIICPGSCSTIEDYGDESAVKTLALIGVKEIDDQPISRTGDTVKLLADKEAYGGVELSLIYSGDKLTKITNAQHPSIVYHPGSDTSRPYPALEEVAKLKAEAEAKAKAKAEAEAKAEAKAEAERKATEARIPTSDGTAVFCEEVFHSRYPYKGSKVHSIMGVIANDEYSADSRLYKVEVTIENGFGAKYGAVMECVVQKTGDRLKITTFNVY